MTTIDTAFSPALWLIAKATAVLALAAIVQAVIHRRGSAALRHLVWTLAIVGVLLLPILSIALPEWTVVTRTATNNPAWQAPPASTIERGVLERTAVSSADGANLTPVRERDISDRDRHDGRSRHPPA